MSEKKIPHGKSDKKIDEIRDYWTPERVKTAIPKPIDKPQPPAGPAEPEAPEVEPNKVATPNTPPYLACGKLLFTWNKTNYIGSASAIDEHVLVTAAHNLYDFDGKGTGSYSTNILFYPAYTGDPPAFSFAYDVALAPDGWVNQTKGSRPHQYDYALVRIPVSMAKIKPLTLVVNADLSGQSHWDAIGYPGTPFDGKTMYEVLGSYTAGTETGTIGMTNNNMPPGSSGGPWLVVTVSGLQPFVNGVNSYLQPLMYSPYFDDGVSTLLRQIKLLP